MSTYKEDVPIVAEAIGSILGQSWRNLEFIIIRDDPTNVAIEAYLEGLDDSRVRVITNPTNLGLARSLNRGILLSRGDFVARMDADDISYVDRIECEVEYASRYDVVWSWVDFVNEDGGLRYTDRRTFRSGHPLPRYGNIVNHSSVMFRREVVLREGGYRCMEPAEDFDLWMRLADQGATFHQVTKPLMAYRLRSSSISNQQAARQKVASVYALRMARRRDWKQTDNFSTAELSALNQRFATQANNLRLGESIETLLRPRKFEKLGKIISVCQVFARDGLFRMHWVESLLAQGSQWFRIHLGRSRRSR
ncbi:MAG: glycosyltransferase [Propionibacteriaceae bacterium]|jgi:glycosyltransferase involved in cell wall biosynthesis|nr:glycosyltransferase [Propionibacteriaceae bacterium]